MGLLLEQNGRVNLTGIRDPAQAERLLLLESIATVLAVPDLGSPPSGTSSLRLLDVGTGGGIPGIPLAIAFPHLSVTLLEATRKKVEFLQRAVQTLALENVAALWGRAEDQAHVAAHREQYDVVTARGVGGLATLSELALPFCALGGNAGGVQVTADGRRTARSQLCNSCTRRVRTARHALQSARITRAALRSNCAEDRKHTRKVSPSRR